MLPVIDSCESLWLVNVAMLRNKIAISIEQRQVLPKTFETAAAIALSNHMNQLGCNGLVANFKGSSSWPLYT